MKRSTLFALAAVGLAVAVLIFLLWPRSEVTPQADAAGSRLPAKPREMQLRNVVTHEEPKPTAALDGGTAGHGETAKGKTVLQGSWGSGAGQFARRRDPESNPEGPMAMLAGAGGELTIVDQINRRVQRFKDGKVIGSIAIGGDTVQDVAAAEGGKTVLLDRLADRNVQVYDRDGKLLNEVPVVGKNVTEGGAVTGVFADDKGIYVEREHATLVRVADAAGKADPERTEMAGRPSRDGRMLIAASINGADRSTGELTVQAFDRSGHALWQQRISLGAPIIHLLMLDSDRSGQIYVGGATGRESPEPPYQIVDEVIAVARLTPGGHPSGSLALPAFPTPDETFRPMSVDDDGNVYLMVIEAGGLRVLRFSFP